MYDKTCFEPDKTIFILRKKEFEQFELILENPPKPNQALKDTMKTPAPWENKDKE